MLTEYFSRFKYLAKQTMNKNFLKKSEFVTFFLRSINDVGHDLKINFDK